jgi:hypothetical protein
MDFDPAPPGRDLMVQKLFSSTRDAERVRIQVCSDVDADQNAEIDGCGACCERLASVPRN